MYASPTKCTQVRRGVRMQKRKKQRDRSDRVSGSCSWLYPARQTSSRGGGGGGAPMAMNSPFVFAKSDRLISSPFFGKRNAFFRVGWARDRFKYKTTRIALFEFDSTTARFRLVRRPVTPVQVPRLVTASKLWSSHSWQDAFRWTISWLIASWDCWTTSWLILRLEFQDTAVLSRKDNLF